MAASFRAQAAAFLAIALAASAHGQAPVAETPVFGTEVKVVAVPVFVTDKAGRAVGGLTAADFELEDQGKKVPLVAFLEIDAAAETPPGAEAGPLVQASARRQFLFLFDLTFSTPTGIMRARAAALEIVRESLLPSDLAAVATFGQRGIQILVSFTPDHSQLERAIATLGVTETQPPPRDMLSIAYDLGLPRWGPGIGPPPAEDADRIEAHLMSMSRQMARADQAVYKQHVDGFLDGLQQLVRTLDAVQGRKQVVLLSAGFDSSVITGATGQESQEASEAVVAGRVWEVQSDRYFGDSRARDALDSVFKSVAATDTVIHTVDVTGMSARGGAAEALPQPIGRGRDTLAQFAANTGGRFVADANDLQAGLESLLDASRRYYVVAFEPLDPKSKPERLRRLKVRVRGDGLQVSHRRGYVIADPKREATPATAALQAAEAIAKGLSGGDLALRAVSVPYRNGSGGVSLPVILEVDGRRLSELKAKQLALEVFGYAFDGDGRILDIMTLAPVLDLAQVRPALESKGLQVITAFAVPEGSVDLRFLVREKTSKLTGSLRLQLEMPGFAADGVVLSPPLAMDDPRARLVVPAASRRQPQLSIPFRVGEMAFTAEPLPTLVNGAMREICVMAWSGGESGSGSGGNFDVRLVDAAGTERPVPLAKPSRAIADADGTTRYVLTLAPNDVPKGRYRLLLALGEAGSDATPRSELPVRVE